MEIKKIFTSTGLNGLKELTFKNLTGSSGTSGNTSGSSGQMGSGINLIYFTNITNLIKVSAANGNEANGINFLGSGKIKTFFNSFIIPPSFVFYNKRVSTLKYSKYFKTNLPKIGASGRILKTIPTSKTEILQKSSFYDLTSLGEVFKTVSGISELKAIQELLSVFKNIAGEYSKTFYKKDTYICIETDYNNMEILDLFMKFYRIKNKLIDNNRNLFLKGIFVKVKNMYYPLTEEKTSLNGTYLAINMQAFNKIKKVIVEIHKKELQELIKTGSTNETEDSIYKLDTSITTDASGNISIAPKLTSTEKSINLKDEILSNLDKVKELDKVIKDKKTEVKINTILNTTNELILKNEKHLKTSKNDNKETPNEVKEIGMESIEKLSKDPRFEKYHKQLQQLKEVNFKFNGSIKVQQHNLPKNLYFDPVKITGIETYTGYNKQQTEFDEVLDEAMFDLFKSMEDDVDAGIKIQDVKISFEDNIKNRFKIYKIKLKNTKFGYQKPYDIQLKVPYPSQGKYIKLDSNKYIMINQLFPYPILKIQPNVVRIYTHFSTAAVELKGSKVQMGSNDLNRIKDSLLINLTESKNKVKVQELDDVKVQYIKDKYQLPTDLNDKLFVNIEIQ
jgi:hypothetical protein